MPPMAPASTDFHTPEDIPMPSTTNQAATMNSTAAPIVPTRSAFSGGMVVAMRTIRTPISEQTRPVEASIRGSPMRLARKASPISVPPSLLSISPTAMVDAMAIEAIMEPQ